MHLRICTNFDSFAQNLHEYVKILLSTFAFSLKMMKIKNGKFSQLEMYLLTQTKSRQYFHWWSHTPIHKSYLHVYFFLFVLTYWIKPSSSTNILWCWWAELLLASPWRVRPELTLSEKQKQTNKKQAKKYFENHSE